MGQTLSQAAQQESKITLDYPKIVVVIAREHDGAESYFCPSINLAEYVLSNKTSQRNSVYGLIYFDFGREERQLWAIYDEGLRRKPQAHDIEEAEEAFGGSWFID